MLRVLKIYFKIYNHFEDRFYNKNLKSALFSNLILLSSKKN